MDDLEAVRIAVVDAMVCLGDALEVGLPAQAPKSNAAEIAAGLEAFKVCIEQAMAHASKAEAVLKRRS